VPSVTLYKESPKDTVNLANYIGKKTVVMFGVPGAYTPGCSKVRVLLLCEGRTNLHATNY
jgi:peroxiredoxin 5